jgi:hypothetical protein
MMLELSKIRDYETLKKKLSSLLELFTEKEYKILAAKTACRLE